MIRVAVVDSEEVFREGVTKLLNEQPHIDVVFQCSDFNEALKKCRWIKPSIILIGTHTLDVDISSFLQTMANSLHEVKLVMMSRPDSQYNPTKIMKAGAKACLSKNISSDDLLKSIELISSGRIVVSPAFAEQFLNTIGEPAGTVKNINEPASPYLSNREIEIAKLAAEGYSNDEIAGKLFITRNTVKAHLKSIFHKLEVRNRQQLAGVVIAKRWVAENKRTEEMIE